MNKTKKRTCILNSIVMYINSMPASNARTDLLHLMEELETVSPKNCFNTRMAIIYSIGAKSEEVIEVINKELNIDLIAKRK